MLSLLAIPNPRCSAAQDGTARSSMIAVVPVIRDFSVIIGNPPRVWFLSSSIWEPPFAQPIDRMCMQNLHARTEKLDLELAVGDGFRLSDQLAGTLLGHCAGTLSVEVNSVRRARRLSISDD